MNIRPCCYSCGRIWKSREKRQVQEMVKILLNLEKILKLDDVINNWHSNIIVFKNLKIILR